MEARTREQVEDVLLKHGGPDLHAFVTAPGKGGDKGGGMAGAAEAVHDARGSFSFAHG